MKLPKNILDTSKPTNTPLASAHAYLGARAIVEGLRHGADIVICGRVADASPVIGAAWYWHDWCDTDYDNLAGALIAGHLIECSTYVTGANFAGFTEYELETVLEPGFPIAEIERDGTCVVTKHAGTGGVVNVDTVRCQFLYELQGSVYLNSDVKAYLNDVAIAQVGKDRYVVYRLYLRPDKNQSPRLRHQRRASAPNNQSSHLPSRRVQLSTPPQLDRLRHRAKALTLPSPTAT